MPQITYDSQFFRSIDEAKVLNGFEGVTNNFAVQEKMEKFGVRDIVLEVLDAEFDLADYKVTVFGKISDGNIYLDEYPVLYYPHPIPSEAYANFSLKYWFELEEHGLPFFKLFWEKADELKNIISSESQEVLQKQLENGPFSKALSERKYIMSSLADYINNPINEAQILKTMKSHLLEYDDGANELADIMSGVMAELRYQGLGDDMDFYIKGLVKIIQGSAVMGYDLSRFIERYNRNTE